MTIIEFYWDGPATVIKDYDVLVTGGSGYAERVGGGNLADKKVVRVLVSLRSKAFMEDALHSMMKVIILFPLSTVAFHGFHK
ncbi:hypothetical protein [Mesorhizobium sp. BR-1-1-10]|uniref:hypothetical protein n=1 Tax=Mesorhizobium sp. BR-1-1-10 TaxID=2876660 RepID=UPI001CD112FF|nr:hypothetical protein [Mesorhizobium sp. BR-1-1-10]MBZ9975516.1 hypothetical protein [Mesorhizobium sp. BR-1-1-10]